MTSIRPLVVDHAGLLIENGAMGAMYMTLEIVDVREVFLANSTFLSLHEMYAFVVLCLVGFAREGFAAKMTKVSFRMRMRV